MISAERAVLAGGSFWGMQNAIRRVPGVLATRVGYTGGQVVIVPLPVFRPDAQAVEALFDPERLSYRDLLAFFFQVHDPTTRDRQGNDVGACYRSAIFCVDLRQRVIAERVIGDVDRCGRWPGKVVTEVAQLGEFREAELEHQDYLVHHPAGITSHRTRPSWVLPGISVR